MNKVKIEGIVKFEPKVFGGPMAIIALDFEDGGRKGSVDVKIFHPDVHKISLGDKIGVIGRAQTTKAKGGKFKDQFVVEIVCNEMKIYEKSANPTPLQAGASKSSLQAKLDPEIEKDLEDVPF